jgi:hypothetical protein
VIPLEEQAVRLGPRGPFVGTLYQRIGIAHLLQSHYEDAIASFEKTRNATLWPAEVHLYLASVYALKADTDRAAAELAEARRLGGPGSFLGIARIAAMQHWGVPKIRALFETTYFAGLRKAGMPEE